MAFVNPNRPAGLSPVLYLNGANYDGKFRMYAILAADTNPYYAGDIVTPVASDSTTHGLPAITLATAGTGNVCLGAIVAVGTIPQGGPYANPANLNQNFRPSGAQSINYYAAVSDDPNIIYEIQEGGAGTNLTAATGNMKNFNFVYAAPATGVVVSGTMIDNATHAVTATLQLKLVSFAQRPDNNFVTSPATGGGSQKWWVLINNHYFRAGITSL